MPHAVTNDKIKLYFEEAGSGTPILFLHEFAADYTNWEPQMRYFSRGTGSSPIRHAAIRRRTCRLSRGLQLGISIRDALAVLDHLVSPKRISSACRWAPIRRCRAA